MQDEGSAGSNPFDSAPVGDASATENAPGETGQDLEPGPSPAPGDARAADSAEVTGLHWGPPHHAVLPLEPLGSSGLYAYLPHRPGAHQIKGSGHTHSAPDHSDIAAASQERRLRDLPGAHRHGFVWMTGHNFVAPDPEVPGIEHMFGAEVYTAKQPQSGSEPHLLAYLPDGALANVSERPFGYFEHDVTEASAMVRAAGGMTAWAHPSRQPLANEELDAIDGLWGMEVVSGATDVEANLGFVDRRLDLGHYVCLTGGGDIHDEDYRLTRGYQLVEVEGPEPSREHIFEQVAACNFFVCETKNADVDPIEPPALFASEAHLAVSLPRKADAIRFIGAGGKILSEITRADSASYAPGIEDGYVRVEIVAEGGQAACYSQPAWLLDGESLKE